MSCPKAGKPLLGAGKERRLQASSMNGAHES